MVVFLLLESVALRVFIHFHAYQESALIEQVIVFRGSVNRFFSFFTDLFHLKQENKRLLEENTRLRNMSAQNFDRVPASSLLHSDTIYIDSSALFRKYKIYSGKVISINRSVANNTLEVQVGTADGVKRDMGVIGPDGIVGVVTNVSNHYAEVLTVLNRTYKISCIHKKSGFVGLIEWEGTDVHEVTMRHFPYKSLVDVGDSVYSSQYSELFPPMSLVGIVTKVEKDPNRNSYRTRIRLSTDLDKITHVYVVENQMYEDRKQLQKQSNLLYNR